MGLVLVVGYGVISYIRGSEAEQMTEQAMKVQRLSADKISPVDDYIKSTLDLVAMDGLDLLGKQGGHIYILQDGISPELEPSQEGKEYVEYGEGEAASKVRYLIHPPEGNVPYTYYSQTPAYPWQTFPLVGSEIHYNGFFGFNRMPTLIKMNNTNSIQEQLENFTITRITKIIDFASFENQGLEITLDGSPSLLVEFNISTVFNLYYPIKIFDAATGAEAFVSDFQIAYPINFVTIQKFANDVISKDVTDIEFDIRTAKMEDYPLIGVQVLEDVYGNDDLVIIEDKASKFIDRSYQFRFMRHNRMPALHYIDIEDEYKLGNGSTVRINANNMLVFFNTHPAYSQDAIQLDFSDPDEDEILITFKKDLPFFKYELYSSEYADNSYIGTAINISVAAFEVKGVENRTHDWQTLEIEVVES